MAVTMTTASKVLKDVYGPLTGNQVNTDTSPFYNAVEQTSAYAVGGKKFIIASPVGLNGGVGFGDEDGTLPTASGQVYENFESTPKNLFGVFQITDKAWKASKGSNEAFINLMESETKSLTRTLKAILCGAMWGTGDGKKAITDAVSNSRTITITSGIQYLEVGMLVDVYQTGGTSPVTGGSKRKIVAVNNKPGQTHSIVLDSDGATITVSGSGWISVQGSYGKEITGVGALFDSNVTSLYGVSKASNPWMVPYSASANNNIDDKTIQDLISYLEDYPGSKVNMIYAGRTAFSSYYAYLEATKRNVNTKKLAGGFESIAFGDIPIVRDKMVLNEGDMYFFDTTVWKFHQLGDWEWLEGYAGNGNILQRLTDKPVYQATMAKYPELICEHPGGQARLTNCDLSE